jgi:hypothetical protein
VRRPAALSQNADRRTVIDISARAGNAKAQSPVLLSDDPHQCPWVDDRRR